MPIPMQIVSRVLLVSKKDGTDKKTGDTYTIIKLVLSDPEGMLITPSINLKEEVYKSLELSLPQRQEWLQSGLKRLYCEVQFMIIKDDRNRSVQLPLVKVLDIKDYEPKK